MSDIVELVCTLPAQYHRHRDKSPRQVVQMLNLARHRSEVNQEKISAYIRENEHLLELWLRWSENKRWSPSWYFKRREPNWLVGKFPGGPELTFDDPIEACSRFVEIELDDILSRN